jgi:hypothetical protein
MFRQEQVPRYRCRYILTSRGQSNQRNGFISVVALRLYQVLARLASPSPY